MRPKLRFKNFAGKWNSITIADYTLSSAFGPRFSSDRYSTSGNVLTLRTTDMDTDGNICYDEAPLASLNLNDFKDHLLMKDDLVISRSGTIGVTGIFQGYATPVIPGAFLIRFRLKAKQLSPNFIRLFFNSQRGRNQIEALSAGGVQKNLTGSSVLKMTLFVPEFLEQQKIAFFLLEVDKKIQLLTRKRELLEQYKKGVMQQLFSAKLRFKDENGKAYPKWEEKKLGEVAEFHKGKGISKGDIAEDGVLECIRYGELYTTYSELIDKVVSKTNLAAEDLFLSRYNDVIIPSSGETQEEIATASCVLKSGVALGGDLNVIRSPLDGIFLSLYLNNEKKHDIAKLAQGSSVVHLYSSQLQNLRLNLPCLNEQQEIANYISGIKSKIENIADQIAKTQTFKKGLLQQMFV